MTLSAERRKYGDVAQVSNLLCRAASSLRNLRRRMSPSECLTRCRLEIGDTAGWKPALRLGQDTSSNLCPKALSRLKPRLKRCLPRSLTGHRLANSNIRLTHGCIGLSNSNIRLTHGCIGLSNSNIRLTNSGIGLTYPNCRSTYPGVGLANSHIRLSDADGGLANACIRFSNPNSGPTDGYVWSSNSNRGPTYPGI